MSIEALTTRFHARVRETVELALRGKPAGDPPWDGHLRSLGVTPPGEAERLALVRAGTPNVRGVLPVELRLALAAIGRETERELEKSGEPGAHALRSELAAFVGREVASYMDRVRPAPTLANIFANARITTVRHEDARDGVKTKKCPLCGAARPEGTDLRVCAFCGNDLFPDVR